MMAAAGKLGNAWFQGDGWNPAFIVAGPGGQLRAERLPAVKVTES